jgi:hypothetical protein
MSVTVVQIGITVNGMTTYFSDDCTITGVQEAVVLVSPLKLYSVVTRIPHTS